MAVLGPFGCGEVHSCGFVEGFVWHPHLKWRFESSGSGGERRSDGLWHTLVRYFGNQHQGECFAGRGGFLGRGSKEEVWELPVSEGELSLVQRLVSPAWTEHMFLKNLEFAKTLASAVPLLGLRCTKEASAAVTMRDAIDRVAASRYNKANYKLLMPDERSAKE